MKRLTWAHVALECVLAVTAAAQQEAPDEGTRELRGRYGAHMHIVRQGRRRNPVRIEGRFRPDQEDIVPGDAVRTSRNLIARNKRVLGVDVDTVALRTVHTSHSGRVGRTHRVEYRPAHNGIPILASRVFVTLRDDGEVLVMGGRDVPHARH